MNVNNSYANLFSNAGKTASQVVVGTGEFVSKSVKNTASVALWSMASLSNVSKKIVPTVLGLASAASAWDVYAYVMNDYSPFHKMNETGVNLPLWLNAAFTVFGTSGDNFEDPKVVSKFFYSAPYAAVGLAIATYASYMLFNNLESGLNYLAKSIQTEAKKPISVTVISLDIEVVQESESPTEKKTWMPNLQPISDAFKKAISFAKQKIAPATA